MSKEVEKREVPVFDLTGSELETITVTVPKVLALRDDLILRAWISTQSFSAEPQGRKGRERHFVGDWKGDIESAEDGKWEGRFYF